MTIYVTYISGNIGSGKSSVMQSLKALDIDARVISIEEPIKKWAYHINQVYNNPKDYAFPFQMEVIHHFFDVHKELDILVKEHEECVKRGDTPRDVHLFVERSSLDGIKIFTELNWENGNMMESEYKLLCDMYDLCRENKIITSRDAIAKHDFIKPRYVYMKCSSNICYERKNVRDRKGENLIDIGYLESVNRKYQDLPQYVQCEFISVDAEQDKETVFLEVIEKLGLTNPSVMVRNE